VRSRVAQLACTLVLLSVPLEAATGPRYGGELRVTAVLPEMDADLKGTSASERFLAGLVHETLLRVGADGLPQPNLASAWSSGPGDSEWTLSLVPGLEFHDGTPMTAPHAVRSLRRFLRDGSSGAQVLAERLEGGSLFRSGESEALAGVMAADDRLLRLRFKAATSALDLLPLAAAAAAVTSERGSGSGPFVPTVTSGGERLYIAFGGHVRGRPYLERVRLRFSDDERKVAAEWRKGVAQIAFGADLPERRPLPARSLLLLVLDPMSPTFASPEARAHVAQAIDREPFRRLLAGAEPWARLLTHPGAPLLPGPGAEPRSARAAPWRANTAITLVVDRSLPPLVSQRIVAHFAALGLLPQVLAIPPSQVRSTRADARLLLFEPELHEPALALDELAAIVSDRVSPAALQVDADRRRSHTIELERRLLGSGALLPLALLPPPLAVAPILHADDPLRIEDAWLLP
jgi:MarR-like DNA-binding transcriptional regulator SgrR of sgrS sRNA